MRPALAGRAPNVRVTNHHIANVSANSDNNAIASKFINRWLSKFTGLITLA